LVNNPLKLKPDPSRRPVEKYTGAPTCAELSPVGGKNTSPTSQSSTKSTLRLLSCADPKPRVVLKDSTVAPKNFIGDVIISAIFLSSLFN
jgi:hypothetical protein